MLGEFPRERFRVAERIVHLYVERGANPRGHDFVRPSAAFQMMLATGFKLKSVESRDDITIISSPNILAAMLLPRAK